MSDDLAAARERHTDCSPKQLCERVWDGKVWTDAVPGCDAALFRDALDLMTIRANGMEYARDQAIAALEALRVDQPLSATEWYDKADAARALADELARRLEAHHQAEHISPYGYGCPDGCPDRAVLAKWETSHVE